jgi:hypothetical protein
MYVDMDYSYMIINIVQYDVCKENGVLNVTKYHIAWMFV